MTNFITFLEQIKHNTWCAKPVTCFYSSGPFVPLFFNHLFSLLKNRAVSPCVISTIKSEDKSVRAATLQQSFLGEQKIYWLGDVCGQDALKFQNLTSLFAYQGPHNIIFFAPSDEVVKLAPKNVDLIELDARIRYETFEKLVSFFDSKLNAVQIRFAQQFFLKVSAVTLDTAVLFLDFLELMPDPRVHGFGARILTLLESESSFFELSNFFFKKDSKNFFMYLKTISGEYGESFWISYWADQLWRAYTTITFLQQKDIAQAKRASFRLPYAFITQLWKTMTLDELCNAHNFLYQADYGLKTGKTFCSLDFFYMKFFNGTFAKEYNA